MKINIYYLLLRSATSIFFYFLICEVDFNVCYESSRREKKKKNIHKKKYIFFSPRSLLRYIGFTCGIYCKRHYLPNSVSFGKWCFHELKENEIFNSSENEQFSLQNKSSIYHLERGMSEGHVVTRYSSECRMLNLALKIDPNNY